MKTKLWHLPLRAATGAYILDQGMSKLGMDQEAAAGLHAYATSGAPEFQQMDPMSFVRLLRTGEIALGTALLVPLVPPGLVGAALMGFSGSLLRFYMKAPGMRREGSIRPTDQGGGIAKDSWMFAIGLALVLDALGTRRTND